MGRDAHLEKHWSKLQSAFVIRGITSREYPTLAKTAYNEGPLIWHFYVLFDFLKRQKSLQIMEGIHHGTEEVIVI